jgi:hypothetical protein
VLGGIVDRVLPWRLFGAVFSVVIAGLVLVTSAQAANFPVSNVNDQGDGSLRQAIMDSNTAKPGPNVITFDIGTGAQTISLLSALPPITTPVVIDGSTQPGGTGTAPLIRIDGASAGTGAAGLTVSAGSSKVKDLEITNFSGTGIVLNAPGSDTIVGNYIGTDGTSAQGNASGITVASSGNTIGGTASSAKNVISGNHALGVLISGQGASRNHVEGNFIGTNSTGTAAVANGLDGVLVASKATRNTIGGTTAGSRNVISGNTSGGVDLLGAGTSSNRVEGNYIGTRASGAAALGNQGQGVAVFNGAAHNTVGGTTAAARNVVSGNAGDGVDVNGTGTSGNRVEGNYIGLNARGSAALGNGGIGAPIFDGATGNTLGGTTRGARNVISGNAHYGATLVNTGTSHNVIEGNYIGTNRTGKVAVPNHHGGVFLYEGSTHNRVGGPSAGARNVISGNGSAGVGIDNRGTSHNLVEGNFIGTKAGGSGVLGNAREGVVIYKGATLNTIGGTTAKSANRIAHNKADGVRVNGPGTRGNRIERNSIFANGAKLGIGIALTKGGNGRQAAPVIKKVSQTRSATKVIVKVHGPAKYRVELFANPSCSHAEGKQFVGAVNLKSGTYSLTLSSHLRAREGVTATATNQSTSNTSQFSGCKTVP